MKEFFDELLEKLRTNIAEKLEGKSEEEITELTLFICSIIEYAMPRIKKEELKMKNEKIANTQEGKMLKVIKNIGQNSDFIIMIKFLGKAIIFSSSIFISENFLKRHGMSVSHMEKLAESRNILLEEIPESSSVYAQFENDINIGETNTEQIKAGAKNIFLLGKEVELFIQCKETANYGWAEKIHKDVEEMFR